MRSTSCAVLAIAIGLATLSGCSVARHDAGESHWWQWETSKAEPQPSLQQQYNISVGPERPQLKGRNDFDFEHPKVTNFVTRYQTDLRSFYGRALERSARYVPRIEPILRKEGVPEEFAYLPLVESGFRTHAVSPARAVGLWQFIPGTGRRYGLRIDSYVDERRDPVKSTHAAARYLKDLYSMFGDWHLSLAAYNTGEGRITRIMNSSDSDDFWEISDRGYLYRETEDYVPGFLAALQIASAPQEYGFEPPGSEPQQYDLVHVYRLCPLSKVAEWCGTSTDEIKELNPALHRGVVPPSGYQVRVPKGTKQTFESVYASLSPSELSEIERAAQPRVVAKRRCVRRGGRTVCTTPSNRAASGKAGKSKARSSSKSRVTKPTRASAKMRVARSDQPSTVVATRNKQSRKAVN